MGKVSQVFQIGHMGQVVQVGQVGWVSQFSQQGGAGLLGQVESGSEGSGKVLCATSEPNGYVRWVR